MHNNFAVLTLIVFSTAVWAGDPVQPETERPVLEEILREAHIKRRLLDKELAQLQVNTEKEIQTVMQAIILVYLPPQAVKFLFALN